MWGQKKKKVSSAETISTRNQHFYNKQCALFLFSFHKILPTCDSDISSCCAAGRQRSLCWLHQGLSSMQKRLLEGKNRQLNTSWQNTKLSGRSDYWFVVLQGLWSWVLGSHKTWGGFTPIRWMSCCQAALKAITAVIKTFLTYSVQVCPFIHP